MPDAVSLWWMCLCAAAAFNIAAWCGSFRLLQQRRGSLSAEVFSSRRYLAWLSAIYVLGCAFRSVLPMVDVPRICTADLPIARIAVGRSVATIAELCFVAQWAWVVRELAMRAHSQGSMLVSRLLTPMIVLAELASWYAVLTTRYFWHLVENSLWTLAALSALLAFPVLWPALAKEQRRWIAGAGVGSLVYIVFMLAVDLPMYYRRWQEDLLSGQAHLSLAEGAVEVLQRCAVEMNWAAWSEDVTWLTLYFTFAVWSSIALMHFPAGGTKTARS